MFFYLSLAASFLFKVVSVGFVKFAAKKVFSPVSDGFDEQIPVKTDSDKPVDPPSGRLDVSWPSLKIKILLIETAYSSLGSLAFLITSLGRVFCKGYLEGEFRFIYICENSFVTVLQTARARLSTYITKACARQRT